MTKIKIKRGDRVRVITGKDKGKDGKVLHIDRANNRVVVEQVNMITKHQKPNRSNQTGGIVRKEAPIHISNVMYLHQGEPTRLGYIVDETEQEGVKRTVKQRIARSTGDVIE